MENQIKIYNQDKTEILKEYDLSKGEIVKDKLIIHHDEIIGQKEEGHYETVAEYKNGGKDIKWVIDKPYIEHIDAYDEEEEIGVYIPYSEEEIQKIKDENELYRLKDEIASTDYEALKYAEGWFTEEEYAPIKQHREELRKKIRQLEEKLV